MEISKEDCSPFYTGRKTGCESKYTSTPKPKDYAVYMLTLSYMERGDPHFNRLISNQNSMPKNSGLKHGNVVPYYLSGSRSSSPFSMVSSRASQFRKMTNSVPARNRDNELEKNKERQRQELKSKSMELPRMALSPSPLCSTPSPGKQRRVSILKRRPVTGSRRSPG